jgi:hypothetical protein
MLPRARSAAESPEDVRRVAGERRSGLLLQMGGVGGQYVAQSFRWIKQHLRIKSFFGTSENAVKLQIWIAVSVYVLVAIIKKRLALSRSLYEILQILSLNLFEKTPLDAALTLTPPPCDPPSEANQLILFD